MLLTWRHNLLDDDGVRDHRMQESQTLMIARATSSGQSAKCHFPSPAGRMSVLSRPVHTHSCLLSPFHPTDTQADVRPHGTPVLPPPTVSGDTRLCILLPQSV